MQRERWEQPTSSNLQPFTRVRVTRCWSLLDFMVKFGVIYSLKCQNLPRSINYLRHGSATNPAGRKSSAPRVCSWPPLESGAPEIFLSRRRTNRASSRWRAAVTRGR